MELLLLTHHHGDHVAENSVWKERHGVEILAHPIEAKQLDDVDRTIEPGETLEVGGLTIESILTPGHTAGMLNFVVNGTDVFTGDTLFKGSVGGVRAPGSTSFEDLRHSIMDVLMKLPHETVVHPGHTDPTTIGDEWESNAFVRLWRGLDEEGTESCTRGGPGRDARAVGARLRRRQQGVGPLARRQRRHRARKPGQARLAVRQQRRQPCRQAWGCALTVRPLRRSRTWSMRSGLTHT